MSNEALWVVSEISPINFLAQEKTDPESGRKRRRDREELRKKAKIAGLSAWQERWQMADKGRWTRCKSVTAKMAWVRDLSSSQALKGHGCFA